VFHERTQLRIDDHLKPDTNNPRFIKRGVSAFESSVFARGLHSCMRISAIVDGHFSLIVDVQTALLRTRRGGAQALGLNVAQASTISLKRSCVQAV
jgi:hypothetical protein